MAVGPGLVMNYVWAGLFHPARKVRTPYCELSQPLLINPIHIYVLINDANRVSLLGRLYNNAYVQSADSMVPFYPNFDEKKLQREELYIMI